MMVIDTVHSSGVGRMHAGQTRRMTIVRPTHSSLQGSEAKRELLSAVDKKGTATDSRPSLVIRRRIMVPQLDEPECHQLPPALPNPPKSSATTLHHSTDHSAARSHLHAIFARSADEVHKSSEAAMTKAAPKTVHLFDLNELPGLTDSASPSESPTSTIASADSTTHVTPPAPPMTTDSSPSMINALIVPDAHRGGAKLAVDLGILPLEPAHHRHDVEDSSVPPELPTPARKRLRKLSEYATSAHDGGHHRDVTKTVAVRGRGVVDDEVLAAATVLMMLASSKKRRRELSSAPSIPKASLDAGPSTSSFASDLAASETSSPTSLGSVLLRPSNKQRYRTMAELMAQTPILRRV